jgi:multidrug efflux pump subunit AcrA (membrane-fusion protein)
LFLSGYAISGISQELARPTQTLTLQQAIERALANYPALQIQRYEVEQALGQKTTAGLLPNPLLSYYKEDLDLSGQKGGEEIFSAGLPLNFLWNRWPQVSAAEAQIEASNLVLANVQRLVKFEVQKAFNEYLLAKAELERAQRLLLISVGSMVEEKSRTVPVIFEVDNPNNKFKIGMFAEVAVQTGEAVETLAIPTSAIFDDSGTPVAYVHVEGEAFAKRVLQTGISDRGFTQILSGLPKASASSPLAAIKCVLPRFRLRCRRGMGTSIDNEL